MNDLPYKFTIDAVVKPTLGILCMFKDEEETMEEWILHHKEEGVSEFVLLNNNSSDDSPRIASNLGATVIACPEKYSQEKYLNTYGSNATKWEGSFMRSDWIMIIDVDEFVYARKGIETIPQYLSTISDSVDGIRLTFKMFGSSNNVFQPRSVINEYTLRGKDNQRLPPPQDWNYKTIYRNRSAEVKRKIYTHAPEPFGQVIYPVDYDELDPTASFVSAGRRYCEKSNDFLESEKFLNLNHYSIQSRENFFYKKAHKGDVNQKKWEERGVRNKSFFNKRDFRSIEDRELKNKRGKLMRSLKKPVPAISLTRKPIKENSLFCYWDKGPHVMPESIQNIIFNNKFICDKHDISFHLITDLNINEYLETPAIFWKLKYNHKSDFVRWSALNTYGGMWLDTDILLLKDPSPLLSDDAYQLKLNAEMSLSDTEYNAVIDKSEIIKTSDFKNFSKLKDPYIKLGCCAMQSRAQSTPTSMALKLMNNILSKINIDKCLGEDGLIDYKHLPWHYLGPKICTDIFKNNSSVIKVFNEGVEDKLGYNLVTWKVDKSKGCERENLPGHNKSQWLTAEKKAKAKAKRILNNPDCFYIPTWSIYRENNIEGDVCDFLFRNKSSVFKYLIHNT